MMKFILPLLILAFFQIQLTAQTIVRYPQGSILPDIVDPNVTVSNIILGPGLSQLSCSDMLVVTPFNQPGLYAAYSSGQYIEFTITPNSGYQIHVTSTIIRDRTTSLPLNAMPFEQFGLTHYYNSISSENTYNTASHGIPLCGGGGGNINNTLINYVTSNPVTVRMAFYGYTTNLDAKIGRIEVLGSTALPVKLKTLEVKSEKVQNVLSFTTASESNNAGFDIERSSDGIAFENIGWIDGNGSTTEEKHYTFIDTKPSLRINYYRLRQVDYDGRFEYSKIVSLMMNSDDVIIFPNPATDILNVQNAASGSYLIKSVLGTIIGQGELDADGQIDISNLPSGTYLFHPESGRPLIFNKL
jgi:Secretion system C-terminal sorting domain